MSDVTVFEILEELENTAGSNAKKEILQRHRRNDLLKRVFIAAQDPYTVYFVNKFKMPKPLAFVEVEQHDLDLDAFLTTLLPSLSSREITGNSAKEAVERSFGMMHVSGQKWCQRILLKNLRCGVQESTVNKIWPGTLNSFAVALACTLKSEFVKGEGIKILEKVKYPVRVEPKLDGLRCIAVKQNGVVTFYTRNGTLLETMPKIRLALETADYDNIVLDAETMGKDWNESASVVMSKKTQRDDSNIIYNMFDAMPLEDWIAQKSSMTYTTRVSLVHSVVSACGDSAPVKQVPHIMAQNEQELKDYFAKCMDEGFEGVMLKTLDTPYVFKRSDNILKLKPCVTYEGVIVDHYEGRHGSKREHMFGGFEVLLPNGVITRIGGGFNDVMRAEVQLSGADSYIGKIVECEAQPDPLTPDGLTEDGKMRFPVFCRFREQSDVDPKIMEAFVRWNENVEDMPNI